MVSYEKKMFGSIKDFEKMVSELLQKIKGDEAVNIFLQYMDQEPSAAKDTVRSKKLRNEGNKFYVKSKTNDDFKNVLWAYNESIAYAPIKSEELALSYANRAMVLFRLEYFSECLSDINRALGLNYPEKSIGKLLIKKIRCMKIINHPDLQIFYNYCLKWIDEYANNAQDLRAEIQKAYEKKAPSYTKSMDIEQFRDAFLESMKISCPNLDNVEIGRDSNGMLSLFITRDIHAGEVIAVQKNYTQILREDLTYICCGQCIMTCRIPIPCDRCSKAMYCSESCKAEAWGKHHEYECQIMGISQALEWMLYIPAMICIYAMKQLGGILPLMKEVYKMSNSDDMKKEQSIVDGVYPSESYRSVYCMTNKFPAKIDLKLDIVREISAFVYLIATRTTLFNQQYLGDFSTVMKERVPKFFVSLILRQYVMTEIKATNLVENPRNEFIMKWMLVCPLFEIINHSCNPNSIELVIKDHKVILAIDEIKKGQKIEISYVALPLVLRPLAERRKIIEKTFGFQCNCKVCATNTSHELVSFRVLEKNPQKLMDLSIIYRKVQNFVLNYIDNTRQIAPEFLGQFFEELKLFFTIAPPLCEETIYFKFYFLTCNFYAKLQERVFDCFPENHQYLSK